MTDKRPQRPIEQQATMADVVVGDEVRSPLSARSIVVQDVTTADGKVTLVDQDGNRYIGNPDEPVVKVEAAVNAMRGDRGSLAPRTTEKK